MKTNTIHRTRTAMAALCLLVAMQAHVLAEPVLRDTWAQTGRVTVEGKDWQAALERDKGSLRITRDGQSVNLVPFKADGTPAETVSAWRSIEDSARGQVAFEATFSAGASTLQGTFSFSDAATICVTPGDGLAGVRLQAPIAVGVLPGIQLDAVTYHPKDFTGLEAVHVPAENWFAGLIEGGDGMLACAWEDESQSVSLLGDGDAQPSTFKALEIGLAGHPLYLEVLAAPAIWHREALELGFLERDVALDWKPPFEAIYTAQFIMRGETSAMRTFNFQKKRNVQYRPEVGQTVWPVWFEDETAYVHVSKRIPPRGDAIFYPVDGHTYSLMRFLGRCPAEGIVRARNTHDPLPHGPRGAENVGFVACGGTEVIRAGLFAAGVHAREKAFLTEYADFLSDYVAIVQLRHAAFFRFIEASKAEVAAWLEACPEGDRNRPFLESMRDLAERTDEGMRVEMELYGGSTPEAHMARAEKDAERIKELLKTDDPEVYPELNEIVYRLNRLAWGHAEGGGMRFSMLVRDWAQKAATESAALPEALPFARALRADIRKALNGAPPW